MLAGATEGNDTYAVHAASQQQPVHSHRLTHGIVYCRHGVRDNQSVPPSPLTAMGRRRGEWGGGVIQALCHQQRGHTHQPQSP